MEWGGGALDLGSTRKAFFRWKNDSSLLDLLARGYLKIYNEEKREFRVKPTNQETKNCFFDGKKVVKMVKKTKIKYYHETWFLQNKIQKSSMRAMFFLKN